MPFTVPSWLRWYRKPSYFDLKIFTQTVNEDVEQGVASGASSVLSQSDDTIPETMALDLVLARKTCSPLSLYDFFMYLKHIELSPENLEFYIWFRDYERRYREDSKSSFHDAPDQDTTKFLPQDKQRINVHSIIIVESDGPQRDAIQASDFERYVETLMPAPSFHSKFCQPCKRGWQFWTSASPAISDSPLNANTYSEELQAMASYFLIPGLLKELNLPGRMRKNALDGIAQSESPESLVPVVNHVYYLLKNCSHRNFIRLGVNNGTFETLCMVTIVGMTFIGLGFLTMLLVAFASPVVHKSVRWRGLAASPFWIVGFSFLLAGMRGSCFLLLLFARRQELPWERIQGEDKAGSSFRTSALKSSLRRLMIFERRIRVNDQGLRNLQHKIVIQSVVGAIIATAMLDVGFLCLPIWT